MCLDPGSYVESVVYARLVERGVASKKAAGVARKVRRAYEAKRAAARHERATTRPAS